MRSALLFDRDRVAMRAALRDHVRERKAHPMRDVEHERDKLKAELATLRMTLGERPIVVAHPDVGDRAVLFTPSKFK